MKRQRRHILTDLQSGDLSFGRREAITFPYEGFQHKSISMRCFQIG